MYVPASNMSLSEEPSHFLWLSSHGGGRFCLDEMQQQKQGGCLFPTVMNCILPVNLPCQRTSLTEERERHRFIPTFSNDLKIMSPSLLTRWERLYQGTLGLSGPTKRCSTQVIKHA